MSASEFVVQTENAAAGALDRLHGRFAGTRISDFWYPSDFRTRVIVHESTASTVRELADRFDSFGAAEVELFRLVAGISTMKLGGTVAVIDRLRSAL